MKKLLVLFLIIPLIMFCSFKKKEKPYILLSSGTIPRSEKVENIRIERVFLTRQRINYAVIAPDGFKYDGVRVQISKQEEKVSNWGFSIVSSKDIYIDKYKKYYSDYIFMQQPGHYILQFFYLNNKDYPFAHKEFIVQ